MSEDCLICKGGFNKRYIAYQDENWVIRHSEETDIPGYFIIQPKRHILDLGEANDAEANSYGPLLKKLMAAVHGMSQCERVYTFSLAEMVPHYHLHVIPRSKTFPEQYVGRGITAYPTKPALDEHSILEQCRSLRNNLELKN